MVPIAAAIAGIVTTVVESIGDAVKRKQELKRAAHENRVRLLKSEQQNNHEWEMRQLENAGWKDDVLFYAWLGFFIWSGLVPEQAAEVVRAWETLPDWFLQVTFWIVAAVLGVKKVGEYLPSALRGMKDAMGGKS